MEFLSLRHRRPSQSNGSLAARSEKRQLFSQAIFINRLTFLDLTRRAHAKALYYLGALKFSLYVLLLVGASFFLISIQEAKKQFKLSCPCSSNKHVTKLSRFQFTKSRNNRQYVYMGLEIKGAINCTMQRLFPRVFAI